MWEDKPANRRLIIEFVVLALIILSSLYVAGSGIIAIFAEYAPPEKIAAVRSVVGFIFGGAGLLSSLTCLLLYYREKGRSELKSALKELELANLELARVDGIRSEFMSRVSHELRTPLTSLMESISLVLDGTLGKINYEQGDFLALAHKEICQSLRLLPKGRYAQFLLRVPWYLIFPLYFLALQFWLILYCHQQYLLQVVWAVQAHQL